MILGEKMPDKDDPKYREKYEKDVEAGRRFARATRIDRLAGHVQRFAERRRGLFLGIVMATIDGDVIYDLKAGTQTDTKIRLRGKGVPHIHHEEVRGDQYVTLIVQVPTKLTNEQRDLLKAFNESMGGKNPDDGKKKKFFGK